MADLALKPTSTLLYGIFTMSPTVLDIRTIVLGVAVETDTVPAGTAQILNGARAAATETDAAIQGSMSTTVATVYTLSKTLAWDLGVLQEDYAINPDLQLSLEDTVLHRAPTMATFTAAGGIAETEAKIYIDDNLALDITLDSNGDLGPTSVGIEESDPYSDAGDHECYIVQTDPDTGETLQSASITLTLEVDPEVAPGALGDDAAPVAIAAAFFSGVRHFVFQDLAPGGLGSYVFPINPTSMTSPHMEFAINSVHTTAPISEGRFHIYRTRVMAHEWTLTGVCISEEMQETLDSYANLNRRIYIIDHRNRAWKCAITGVQFVPRLRKAMSIRGNALSTADIDWVSDYTLTAVVLDQNWLTPA